MVPLFEKSFPDLKKMARYAMPAVVRQTNSHPERPPDTTEPDRRSYRKRVLLPIFVETVQPEPGKEPRAKGEEPKAVFALYSLLFALSPLLPALCPWLFALGRLVPDSEHQRIVRS